MICFGIILISFFSKAGITHYRIFNVLVDTVFSLVLSIPEITLTSSPPSSNGYFCPGPVQFTCVGTEIDGLTWRINRTYRASYVYSSTDTYPVTLSSSPPLPDVVVLVTEATTMGPNRNNITSTMNFVQEYVLRETFLECIPTSTIRTSIMIAGTRGIRNISYITRLALHISS